MWQFRPQVLAAVDDNQVVIVCGETGWYVTVIYHTTAAWANMAILAARARKYLHFCWNTNYLKAGTAKYTVQNLAEFRPSLWPGA